MGDPSTWVGTPRSQVPPGAPPCSSRRPRAPTGSAGTARRLARGALILAFALALTPLAGADGSILHEPIPPDPSEDVALATTTLDGDLPAAIQTPSGVATAPDPRDPPSTQQQVYNSAATDSAPDSTYEPDRDTRRPNVESYDDPFSPATAPFKRLRAYDEIGPDYALHVHHRDLSPIKIGGSLAAGDEPFYGDIAVEVIPDQPVRIPTVGPGVRLLRMHVNPEQPLTLVRDGADNWFVRGTKRERVRLVVELAIPRATFGSEFADIDWSALDPHRVPQFAGHNAAFEEVARAIGVSRAMRPREAVQKLVEYFRSFAPSDDPPKERGDIYLDLALSKKGVCRHRAFAFLVTALHLGIPARMVLNEAHAWVEVFDATLWHRIDLGGAALTMEQDVDPSHPPYVPPPDPYAWPESRDSGQDLADRSRAEQGAGTPPDPGGSGNGASASASSSAPSAPSAPLPSASTSSSPRDPAATQTEILVTLLDKDIRRGFPLHLQGHVNGEGGPCAHVRVDVLLASEAIPRGAIVGSLSTDDRGRYDGAIVVPRDFAVGDYDLLVTTPGDTRCLATRTTGAR